MTTTDRNNTWVEDVTLTPPSLNDNTADVDRLINTLKNRFKVSRIGTDLALARAIPECLRAWDYNARCILFEEGDNTVLIGIEAPDAGTVAAGMAIDLGTTRVVVRLIDLETAEPLAESSFENPQTSVGDDILTRIHYADAPDGLETLNRLIVDGINHMAETLCTRCGIQPENIHIVSVAGNTTMTHFFLNLQSRWIIREPYIPAVNNPGVLSCAQAGLKAAPHARLFVFPNVGSYFGGDLIAGILFSGIHRNEETSLLVDVGTNAEVVLGDKDWLMACAGAAGPALEGGVAGIGAKAGPGVIDGVTIDPETHDISVSTIDDLPPVGICGSALIDLMAGLFSAGLIDIRGKLNRDKYPEKIVETDGIPAFVVVPADRSGTGEPLTISQPDIDNIIRSKAAMYTILRTITAAVGLSLSDIGAFYVAGTFGSLINPVSAITLGMLPDLPLETFSVLGNSSLEGAAMVLTSRQPMRDIAAIQNRITYLELNVNQEFMNRFSAAKFLPHTERDLFPSVTIPKQ
ncbi:MAG: ASKHA domain-containing protein [Thermodesulfobacteriota bacterium]|nr:ASKHA domain-containing protein [Thermodesulfobacteriota bacterium]